MTRAYDRYGRRIPTARDEERPSPMGVTIIALVFLAFVCAAVTYLNSKLVHEVEPDQLRTMDCMAYTYTDDSTDQIKVYVVTDPDTGVQYVVSDHGGICERVIPDAEDEI